MTNSIQTIETQINNLNIISTYPKDEYLNLTEFKDAVSILNTIKQSYDLSLHSISLINQLNLLHEIRQDRQSSGVKEFTVYLTIEYVFAEISLKEATKH
ncbi:hypothetical protein [Methylovorus glucosotrophus]|uniref:hypothetical protein n=1 Tax=Methylovorus glucosotrophus TaxID=266009 RepID=UPI0011D1196F|nr:hypothetical protein [Methylovorus glucosotrophus]